MKPVSSILLALSGLLAAAPSEYVLTNITGWTPEQLAALPHFDRYVPVVPAGAAAGFVPVCSNGLGIVAGNHAAQAGGADDGALVRDGTQTAISAWGSYGWSYWIWDGTDNHYYWGRVTHSPVRAANVLGQVAGYATLPGGGTGVNSTSGYDDHAYLHDPATGEKTDLTPTAHRADPRDLNDRGDTTGFWSDDSAYHPFRRAADGTFADLVFDEAFSHNISPSVINNHGHVAGLVTVWTTPRDYIPFFSESGSTTTALPYPDQDKAYKAVIADINDHDIIIGHYHKADTPLETLAIRWSRSGGTWTAEDLNELLADNMDFILDRALAVNDAGHIIASGHLDGGPDDTWNTHRFLLTPDTLPPPAITPLAPAGLSATGAVLRVKLNACEQPTTAAVDHGPGPGDLTTVALPPAAGTHPVLAEIPLTGLTPNTPYQFRAAATNASGTTQSAAIHFTTPWDWPTWAAAHLGAADPQSDRNHNCMPDLVDYSTGNGPAPLLALDGDQLKISFRRSLTAGGVTLTVQASDDLVTWNDGSSYAFGSTSSTNGVTTELTRTPDGPGAELITVCADAGNQLFLRLKAQIP